MAHSQELREIASARPLSDTLRLLFICRSEPSWTGLALQLDRLGSTAPRFRWSSSQSHAASLLREESFDVIVVGEPSEGDSDPIVFAAALRAAGTDEPILLVSPRVDDAWLIRCGELDLEILSAAAACESRALAVWLRRTIERTEQIRELNRLQFAEHRQHHESREGSEQMTQQWRRVFTAASEDAPSDLVPQPLRTMYSELLRTYVFFGGSRLEEPMDRLSREVQRSNLPASLLLRLHCECLESLLKGCGSRSVRHLQQNSDLFAVEILTRVADGYQQRSRLQGLGDHGIDLLQADLKSGTTEFR